MTRSAHVCLALYLFLFLSFFRFLCLSVFVSYLVSLNTREIKKKMHTRKKTIDAIRNEKVKIWRSFSVRQVKSLNR